MFVKKLSIVLLVFMISSCGNNNTTPADQSTATTENTDVENISNIAMFKDLDCATCHKKTETFTGPSFVDIADRYKNAADTTVASLAQTIINGSSGKWKGMVAAMTPHPAISKADAESMVKYILEMKK